MFAYCNNNPICYSDPTGCILAYDMFIEALEGDGSDQEYDEKSKAVRKLKKSSILIDIFLTNVEKFISSGATQFGSYHGSFSTYGAESFNDKDLSLSIGAARYIMTITKETRTSGFGWWKKEEMRYVATITVFDTYDFTEWRTDNSFGSIMNNIAYIGQIFDVVKPYDWQATFTMSTDWEEI